jgi:hypothetical protein
MDVLEESTVPIFFQKLPTRCAYTRRTEESYSLLQVFFSNEFISSRFHSSPTLEGLRDSVRKRASVYMCRKNPCVSVTLMPGVPGYTHYLQDVTEVKMSSATSSKESCESGCTKVYIFSVTTEMVEAIGASTHNKRVFR